MSGTKGLKGRDRLCGSGYKRQRLNRDIENKKGATALQRFLAPVQPPPQQDDQEQVQELQDLASSLDNNVNEGAYATVVPEVEVEGDVEEAIGFDNIINIYKDVGSWPASIPDELRVELVRKGPLNIQNKEGPFPKSQPGNADNRCMNRGWFYKTLGNGEQLLRSWLLYSPSLNCLQCFCCRLFGSGSSALGKPTGFGNWAKLNPRVDAHEESPDHEDAYVHWMELRMRLERRATIDCTNQEDLNRVMSNWRQILTRILDCIRFLSMENLALRGHQEILSSSDNSGNFLELVKFLANYDPVVREHLTRIQAQLGTVSYFSPGIQNEFITILGRHVLDVIIADIQEAKYYTIIFDSTPDVAHIDQMSQVLRYIKISGAKVEVKETFLRFIQFDEKNAKSLTNLILAKLDEDHLDIQDMRGQGYDNAATMSGVHSGVQRGILDINPLATYILCNNHSMNLAGVHSAQVSVNAITFFGTLDRLFVFFSSSTHLWEVFKQHVPGKTVKRSCETRWSARHDAVEAVSSSFEAILAVLEQLRDGDHETANTRSDANILLSCLMSYTFVAYLTFWQPVLNEINDAQLFLQTPGLGLDCCATKLGALVLFCQEQRDNIVEAANAFCEENGIPTERRVRRRRRMVDQIAEDAGLSLQAEVRREQLQIMDRLHQEMQERTGHMMEVNTRFGFLTNMEYFMDSPLPTPTSLLKDSRTRSVVYGVISLASKCKQERQWTTGMPLTSFSG